MPQTTLSWVVNPMIAACAAHADATSCNADGSNHCAFGTTCATTSTGPALRVHTHYTATFDELPI